MHQPENAPTENAPTENAPTENAPTENAPTEYAPTIGKSYLKLKIELSQNDVMDKEYYISIGRSESSSLGHNRPVAAALLRNGAHLQNRKSLCSALDLAARCVHAQSQLKRWTRSF